MKLFVYGTLMQGFGLHPTLERIDANRRGRGRIDAEMYAAGIPHVIQGDGTVHGEVYDVNEENLGPIDAIESGYKRTETECQMENGDTVTVEYYQSRWSEDELTRTCEFVESGDFRDHVNQQ